MINNKKTSVVAQNSFVGTTPFHIAIDYTVSEIEMNAFQHCYSLRIITIPPNVRYIDENAFNDCGALISKPCKNVDDSNFRVLMIRCRQYSPAYYWVDNKKNGFIRILY